MSDLTTTPNIGDALGKACTAYLTWTDDGGIVVPGVLVSFSERFLDNGKYLVKLEIEYSPGQGA